ncbi:glycosyltransferase family 4 protein [Desulfitobacterium metallireducens]|uniref:Glycosyltransferase n=1 Tax=Desulfitobacterium metallireducens DSM 15288 TaxID=871968 RepID=W0EGA3_9FIRM|nr:glycosyltransferase family 4 protein [Desulfitobacterium metallireducens]AHF08096.1 glycosyltransferase [Desulfitobacterium metallireducens DSM 15288]
MRILMLTQYFPPETGAAQVRLFEVAKAIRNQGHDIEVVTAFPNYPNGIIPPEYQGKFYMKDSIEGIPVHRTWIYPVQRGKFWKRLLNYFSFVFSAFYGVLKAGKADYIFVESPPLFIGFTMIFAKWVKGAKLILNVSDLWPESAVSLGLVTNKTLITLAEGLERWMYKSSWRISTQTEGIISSLKDRGIPGEKIVFLPNGVDPDLFAPIKQDEQLLEKLNLRGKYVILYAGTMGYAHGLEVALQAAERLEKDHPEIAFLLVGDGSEKPRLMEMAQEMKLTNVRWVDFQPITQMQRYYSLAHISLSTLRRYKLSEGVRPSKLFPGLASAKPLIYVGEGEGAKIVEESGGGVVIPPEEPQLLAETILMLQQDPGRCQTQGEHGREFVIKNYSWKSIVSHWLRDLGL